MLESNICISLFWYYPLFGNHSRIYKHWWHIWRLNLNQFKFGFCVSCILIFSLIILAGIYFVIDKYIIQFKRHCLNKQVFNKQTYWCCWNTRYLYLYLYISLYLYVYMQMYLYWFNYHSNDPAYSTQSKLFLSHLHLTILCQNSFRGSIEICISNNPFNREFSYHMSKSWSPAVCLLDQGKVKPT